MWQRRRGGQIGTRRHLWRVLVCNAKGKVMTDDQKRKIEDQTALAIEILVRQQGDGLDEHTRVTFAAMAARDLYPSLISYTADYEARPPVCNRPI